MTRMPGCPCPICKKNAAPRAQNPAFPFCSARCKQVDLFHWLHEGYRIPTEESLDDEPAAREQEGES